MNIILNPLWTQELLVTALALVNTRGKGIDVMTNE